MSATGRAGWAWPYHTAHPETLARYGTSTLMVRALPFHVAALSLREAIPTAASCQALLLLPAVSAGMHRCSMAGRTNVPKDSSDKVTQSRSSSACVQYATLLAVSRSTRTPGLRRCLAAVGGHIWDNHRSALPTHTLVSGETNRIPTRLLHCCDCTPNPTTAPCSLSQGHCRNCRTASSSSSVGG